MNGTTIPTAIAIFMVFVCIVIATLIIAGDGGGGGYDSNYDYYEPPKPRVTVEKRRDYDDISKTLKETTTTTKVFPDVDPEDLEVE